MRILLHTFAFAVGFWTSSTWAHAAVVINEVAWMGNDAGANGSFCEWIELHNNGAEAVDLTNWAIAIGAAERVFTSESGAALSITPGGFYLIERQTPNACPDPVPGIDADWSVTFGNGISNSGAVIALKDAAGSPIDTLDMSGGWTAGDNDTKATAQRTPQGWTTAPGTPRAANAAYTAPAAPASGSSSATSAATGNSSSAGPPDKQVTTSSATEKLVVRLTGPTVTYVNQPVTFVAEPSGFPPSVLSRVRFSWSFGDLASALGDEVAHAYAYPGKYQLILSAHYMPHEVELRREITVLPVSVTLTRTADGDLAIGSTAEHAIDLSGFRVHAGGRTYTVPPQTTLLAGATIVVPRRAFPESVASQAVVTDPMGKMVATYPSVVRVSSGASVTTVRPTVSNPSSVESEEAEETGSVSDGPIRTQQAAAATTYALQGDAPLPTRPLWPYAALVAVIGLGFAALFIHRT